MPSKPLHFLRKIWDVDADPAKDAPIVTFLHPRMQSTLAKFLSMDPAPLRMTQKMIVVADKEACPLQLLYAEAAEGEETDFFALRFDSVQGRDEQWPKVVACWDAEDAEDKQRDARKAAKAAAALSGSAAGGDGG